MDYNRRKYPNRLRVIRQNAGLSQQRVSRLMRHRDANKLCSWENGRAMPTSPNLIKLCIIYGKSPEELYPEYCKHLRENLLL